MAGENKSKQCSRVGPEWPVGSVEKKAPLSLQQASCGLFLIAGARESQQRRRLRIYSAFSSWTLPFPPVNTGINLGPAAKAQPRRSLLPSYFTAGQKDTSGRYRCCRHLESEPSNFSTYTSPLLISSLFFFSSLFFHSISPLILAHWIWEEFLKLCWARCRVLTVLPRTLDEPSGGHSIGKGDGRNGGSGWCSHSHCPQFAGGAGGGMSEWVVLGTRRGKCFILWLFQYVRCKLKLLQWTKTKKKQRSCNYTYSCIHIFIKKRIQFKKLYV